MASKTLLPDIEQEMVIGAISHSWGVKYRDFYRKSCRWTRNYLDGREFRWMRNSLDGRAASWPRRPSFRISSRRWCVFLLFVPRIGHFWRGSKYARYSSWDKFTLGRYRKSALKRMASETPLPDIEQEMVPPCLSPTILKLTCTVRGTNPSTLGRKRAEARQIGQPVNKIYPGTSIFLLKNPYENYHTIASDVTSCVVIFIASF
ncbi:hypothetical protein T484DRAFT_1957907 [Baffinella frigidus]|nr:hypothetical protein T484DRAFT_1957907 [Cryptophyta sp. CCMP2293]